MGEVFSPRFDGVLIDIYAGRFSGGFDIDSSEAEEQTLDQEIFFVVRAKVKGAAMSETRSGDLLRTNVYAVSEAARISSDLGFKLQTANAAQIAISFETDLLDGMEEVTADDD